MPATAPRRSTDNPPANAPAADPFDPDDFRMGLGDHLEELRVRLILALVGFGLALAVCLFFGTTIISIFCAPLVNTLRDFNVNPQLVDREVGGAFTVYVKISMVCAAAIASPWIVYQLWQFVAAGLYPHERRYITKYLPLSLSLLVGGEIFVFLLVLPWTLQFFIGFSIGVPLTWESRTAPATPAITAPLVTGDSPQVVAPAPPLVAPLLDGDPAKPVERQIWYDSFQKRLKVYIDGKIRVLQFGPDNLIAPQYTLDDYIDLVMAMLLTFGLCFQTPLVVLALVRVGILEPETLKGYRRHVYLALAVLAAAITPGDVITATVALIIPLVLLYELGIWLAKRGAVA